MTWEAYLGCLLNGNLYFQVEGEYNSGLLEWLKPCVQYKLKQAEVLFRWKEKKKILFLLSVKMLLLQLPVAPRSTDWTATEKLTKHSHKGLPLYRTLFDLSADLACPFGQCVLLQDRDIHRPSGHSCALQPIHSTRRNYIFQLSAARWWKYIGGKRMCGETQSAQSRAHKLAIKVNFIEITLFKAQSATFDLCALFFCGSAAFVRSLIPAICLSYALRFTFSWKHNAAALIMALIGRYTSILS